jgi:hypothetical protein
MLLQKQEYIVTKQNGWNINDGREVNPLNPLHMKRKEHLLIY